MRHLGSDTGQAVGKKSCRGRLPTPGCHLGGTGGSLLGKVISDGLNIPVVVLRMPPTGSRPFSGAWRQLGTVCASTLCRLVPLQRHRPASLWVAQLCELGR